ncbi:MAG TPA: AAA family ATPase [Candidatus Aquilonibacter sp.]|jgi:predicted ATPase|nr:AAA family ATPase [Candidatus Aquilonibacter sp.]
MRKHDIVSDNTERFFVITGGPGSGKTTLIDALQQAGYARSIEAGRGVIQSRWRLVAMRCRGAIRWLLRN